MVPPTKSTLETVFQIVSHDTEGRRRLPVSWSESSASSVALEVTLTRGSERLRVSGPSSVGVRGCLGRTGLDDPSLSFRFGLRCGSVMVGSLSGITLFPFPYPSLKIPLPREFRYVRQRDRLWKGPGVSTLVVPRFGFGEPLLVSRCVFVHA